MIPPRAELWILTTPCELRLDCGLSQYHIHVSDQIFYDISEMDKAYPEGLEFVREEVNEDRVAEWVNNNWKPLGTLTHIHWSTDGTVEPGTFVTTGSDGRARPVSPGETPTGVVVSTDKVHTGSVTINTSMPWSDSASDPVGDIVHARDLMRLHNRSRER